LAASWLTVSPGNNKTSSNKAGRRKERFMFHLKKFEPRVWPMKDLCE
jgi:hypothetical protein